MKPSSWVTASARLTATWASVPEKPAILPGVDLNRKTIALATRYQCRDRACRCPTTTLHASMERPASSQCVASCQLAKEQRPTRCMTRRLSRCRTADSAVAPVVGRARRLPHFCLPVLLLRRIPTSALGHPSPCVFFLARPFDSSNLLGYVLSHVQRSMGSIMHDTLQQVFGLPTLSLGPGRAVAPLLAGRSAAAIFPTGQILVLSALVRPC